MKLLIVLCFAIAAVAAKRTFHGDQVLRITTRNKLDIDQIQQLEKRFPLINFWTSLHGSIPVDIHVPKSDLPAVKALLSYGRLQYKVFIDDLQVAIDNQVSNRPEQMSLETFDYNVYHTLEEINQWIDDMASAYSTVTKVTYGKSYEGRDINAIKISNGGSKPAFVIDCGIHAREWITTATCIYTAKFIIENDLDLLNNMDIYITPTGNPDGYDYTWTDERMWRKTRSRNGGVCIGVDPNRNWDINWSGPGASGSSCNDAYYGPSAMSEVEVREKAAFIDSLQSVKAYIDIHAYSQMWMYPYAFTYNYTDNDSFLRKIAEESATAIRSVHGETYAYGPISEVIYQASGSTSDYMYEKLGIKCSFAGELRDKGRYGFLLPEWLIQPSAEEAYAGLKVIASYVANGQC